MQLTEDTIVIVGGGVAGLLAGLWVQSCGYQAIIIERAKECGGLLRSTLSESGNYFDYGTHIPSFTGNKIVDELMFGSLNELEWIEIPKLKKGNFFRGELNTKSQFIDIRHLPLETYTQALSELINSLSTDRDARSLDEALKLHFGETLAQEVFKPLLQRIYKTPLKDLDANAHRFLAYSRVIVSSSDVSKELKKSPIYDAKIAHPNSHDGGSDSKHLYPRNQGTGAWIQSILARFKNLGGVVLTETAIHSINGKTSTITFTNEDSLRYAKLIWTAPLGLLAKALFSEMLIKQPLFVPTGLHHFVFDKYPLCDSHYIYINNPNARAFRVTLYSNITQLEGDCRVSVEAISDGASCQMADEAIISELVESKIISPDTKLLESHSTLLSYGFPEMTLDINSENELIRQRVSEFGNIVLGGRGAAEVFFMTDVLKNLADSLTHSFGEPKTS